MSNNHVVISTLINKREQLLATQQKVHAEYQEQIDELEDALDNLAGKTVWRKVNTVAYNDESPDYIRNTEDGI
jgi:hypothetical protein